MAPRVLMPWVLVAVAVVAMVPASPASAVDVATQTCAELPAGPDVDAGALKSFEPVTPRRLVDTRDGTGGLAAPIGTGCTMQIDLDAAAVPADAGAVSLSVTALASQPGFLTAFPCAAGQPDTSNLNTRADGIPTPNLVVAIPDAQRRVCIFSLFEADVVIDLAGWWTDEGGQQLTTISPERAVDTREDPGRPFVAAETSRTIPLASLVPADATAVVGNLTVAEPQADGFLTAYPCDSAPPLASNLNFLRGESRAVAVVVGIDPAAQLCVLTSTAAHIVFDVSGYYAPAPQFGPVAGVEPIPGRRVADSRNGQGGWSGKFGAGTTRQLQPTAGLANDGQTTAAILNIVVTEAEADGFVTVFPCDDERPNSSAVNYTPTGESTNMVVVDLSADGEICVYALTAAHIVVDLFGVLAADDGTLAESLEIGGFTWPAYEPAATDYGVECTGNSTAIDLTPLRGVTARLNGVPITTGRVVLPTSTDDRFELQLRRGSTVHDLSFRCLPASFPRLTVDRPGQPAPGWYVTTLATPGSTDGYAVVLDHFGGPVWYKRVPGGLVNVERRSDGRLLSVSATGPRYGIDPDRGYLVSSLFGTVIDELTTVPDPSEPGVEFPADHHDMLMLPGGGRAMLSYPLLDNQDLSILGTGFLANDVIADGVIQEIAANDTLLWRWRTSDHFGYDVSYPQRWGPLEGYDGDEVDIFHLNSLDLVDDGSGDYVVSARHMDNVFRVARATDAVDWVLGEVPSDSPQATKDAQLQIVDDTRGGPRRMHDARLNGDVLTMFDNRVDTGQPSRAIAYRIDAGAGTATMLWEIEQRAGAASFGLGSTRVTGSGSVLVSWGAVQPVFGEYTTGGDTLMEITQDSGGASYRIAKEPTSVFSRDLLRIAAGGSLDMP